MAATESGYVLVMWGAMYADGRNVVEASLFNPVTGRWVLFTVDEEAGVFGYHYSASLTATGNSIYGLWRHADGELRLFTMNLP